MRNSNPKPTTEALRFFFILLLFAHAQSFFPSVFQSRNHVFSEMQMYNRRKFATEDDIGM